jgi:hypothetical protein
MAPITKYIVGVLAVLTMAGCAPKTRYAWHDYDDALYQHYKDPAQYETFVEELKDVVDEGEETGRIPPGMYAEYGYALYEQGKISEAVSYFQKESDKWPESRVFMTKVIAIVQKRATKADDKGSKTDNELKKVDGTPAEVKQ